jgi:heptosyltransferase I
MKKKVLLIRLDKIGDLICTLCTDQVTFLKDCDVQWVIAEGLSFIPENSIPPRKFIELSKDNRQMSEQKLREFIREFKPDIAVSFQAPWWVNYALWTEKVPSRVGVLSQWHSFIFLNKGLRQKRSQSIHHEADYNLDLLRHAFDLTQKNSTEATPVLVLDIPPNPELLDKYSLEAKKYIVVHPGMAGSALNWPALNYIDFIEEIMQDHLIVLTGTSADEVWLKDIKEHFKDETRVLCLQSLLKPKELMTILKNAKAVIAPSTGVAHIAASLGTSVLGIYSPLRVQNPRRWAARGPHVHIFMPTVKNIDQVDPECMKKITCDDLLKQLNSI